MLRTRSIPLVFSSTRMAPKGMHRWKSMLVRLRRTRNEWKRAVHEPRASSYCRRKKRCVGGVKSHDECDAMGRHASTTKQCFGMRWMVQGTWHVHQSKSWTAQIPNLHRQDPPWSNTKRPLPSLQCHKLQSSLRRWDKHERRAKWCHSRSTVASSAHEKRPIVQFYNQKPSKLACNA